MLPSHPFTLWTKLSKFGLRCFREIWFWMIVQVTGLLSKTFSFLHFFRLCIFHFQRRSPKSSPKFEKACGMCSTPSYQCSGMIRHKGCQKCKAPLARPHPCCITYLCQCLFSAVFITFELLFASLSFAQSSASALDHLKGLSLVTTDEPWAFLESCAPQGCVPVSFESDF